MWKDLLYTEYPRDMLKKKVEKPICTKSTKFCSPSSGRMCYRPIVMSNVIVYCDY